MLQMLVRIDGKQVTRSFGEEKIAEIRKETEEQMLSELNSAFTLMNEGGRLETVRRNAVDDITVASARCQFCEYLCKMYPDEIQRTVQEERSLAYGELANCLAAYDRIEVKLDEYHNRYKLAIELAQSRENK